MAGRATKIAVGMTPPYRGGLVSEHTRRAQAVGQDPTLQETWGGMWDGETAYVENWGTADPLTAVEAVRAVARFRKMRKPADQNDLPVY